MHGFFSPSANVFGKTSVFRSKSVSDITDNEMNLGNLPMELRVEEMQKMRARVKDNEDKWQDVSIASQGFVTDHVYSCSYLACGSMKVETSKISSPQLQATQSHQ